MLWNSWLRTGFLSLVMSILGTVSAHADPIVFLFPNVTAGGSLTGITINDAPADVGGRDPSGAAPVGGSIGAATDKEAFVTLSATQLATPFSADFTIQNTTSGYSEYLFHVTLSNDLAVPSPINAFSISLTNGTANAQFNTAFNANGIGNSTDPINNNSGVFTWSNSGSNPTASSLNFGLLSGGGGSLASGQSTTFDFFLYVAQEGNPGDTGTFTMGFTANNFTSTPEPGSLSLALATLGLGGVIRRRRMALPTA